MRIHTHEQLLEALDEIVARGARGDRTRPDAAAFWAELLTREGHPLATDLPDENLLDWHARGLLGDLVDAQVLDIGCGRGRNTRWFAEQGAHVDGVDIATNLLGADSVAMPKGATLATCDILRDELPHTAYDLVYDSGCFHHLAPHRRETYRDRLMEFLVPGGRFGIVAFVDDEIESPSDVDILASGDVGGGIGYSLQDLTQIFEPLRLLKGRGVRAEVDGAFGESFLNAALFQRE